MSLFVAGNQRKPIFSMGLAFLVMLMAGSLSTMAQATTLATAAASFAPNRTAATPAQIWQRLKHARWFTQGTGPNTIYLIFDPNCPYCHLLINELQALLKPDALTIRYVPVGFLEPSSMGKAAAILEAKNPLQALWENEKGFTEKGHDGAIQEILPSAATEKALKNNLNILEATGQKTVPTMLYQNSRNQPRIVWQVLDPKNLAQTLKSLHRRY
ncbi:thioredoxin fold domain-containing protein [Acidithiobacillus sp. M4-SHS-6]|uniref:thioredoxin fold domain-containing protein n=1 Tax=Acidithiobacillus sp. M4-SHS-6 TaxID=3383024 RepID=UPI0039BEB70C